MPVVKVAGSVVVKKFFRLFKVRMGFSEACRFNNPSWRGTT